MTRWGKNRRGCPLRFSLGTGGILSASVQRSLQALWPTSVRHIHSVVFRCVADLLLSGFCFDLLVDRAAADEHQDVYKRQE